ncbi:hypothetical protein HY623_02165 [Candidatus Uhrbacteria bacterium]|nr:hypothetical protein [Candidatus Uhrbacteria bacterium]
MKKEVIIVLCIGVVILFVLVFGARFVENKTAFIENKEAEMNTFAQEASAKLIDAEIEVAMSGMPFMFNDWYDKNNQSYANFTADQDNNDAIQKIIDTLEKKKNIQLDYAVASTKDMYVVRITSSHSNKFYCIDSSKTVYQTPALSEEVFKSQTNCKGESF